MIAVKENQDVYFSSFERLEKRLAGKQPAWLGPIRQAAMNRFAELGFPTSKNEEWKFTSVAPIARLAFEPAEYEFNTVARALGYLHQTEKLWQDLKGKMCLRGSKFAAVLPVKK